MAKRIFELARELGVTSKTVLAKCRDEDLDIKNHMSTVSAGLEATIREWFSEDAESRTAVERSEHVDLAKAREEARKARRRRQAETEAAQEQTPSEQEAAEEAAVAVAEAPAETAEPPAETVEPEEESEAPGAAPPEPAPEVPAEVEPPAEAAEAPAPASPEQEPPAEAEPQTETEPPEEAAEEAETGREAAEAEQPEETEEPEKPEPIRPAGPQVVPKPAELKGPRVVRVEKPDYVRPPRPRPRAKPRPGPVPPPDTERPGGRRERRGGGGSPPTEREGGKRRSQRRSPRRRSGRSADSGDRIREWRDQDLAERSERLAAATGGGLRRHRAAPGRRGGGGGQQTGPPGKVEIDEPITVKSLSAAAGVKSADIIRWLMQRGVLATINQVITREQAEGIASDCGIELQIKRSRTAEEDLLEQLDQRKKGERTPRAPVVTFLGHVDHGKTSLLDRIRDTEVADGEAGGITQHIGAYRYDKDDVHVVFLDTPGHEAFTAMRARGANMTDVVVLVVAADDGVMPQTVEAISHARAAGVPIVVALNKVDIPNANVQRAMGQLAEHDLQPRQWGGEVEVVETSAETGQGVEELVELLSLEAELLELTAERDAPGRGFVIEAQMDPGRGVVARLLVRDGTMRVGDVVLAGLGFGRIRQMVDSRGRSIEEAGPSTPVEVAGLDDVPIAGDSFYVTENLEQARAVAEDRRERARSEQLAAAPQQTLESLLGRIEAGEAHELALIIKADVQGSVEALTGSLEKLSTDEVRVNILHAGVGGITTGDVALAEASGALIIGFNVVPAPAARTEADNRGVTISLYRVIYDLIEDVRRALEEGLAPEVREEVLAHAEVRQTFRVSRIGTIAGCFVTDGTITRNAKVRVIRDNVVVENERQLDSLKRFKDDVREVRNGMECGIKLAGYDDVKEGDVLEFYQRVEVARTL